MSLHLLPDQGQKYGYVFYDCRLTADDGVRDVALSRPWRPYAQAVFIRCNLGKHISPVGWNNWGNKEAERQLSMQNMKARVRVLIPKRVFLIPIN